MTINIALAITGSIAAYKACDIIQEFKRNGCSVRVLLSKSGAEFITPLTLQTLSGKNVIESCFTKQSNIDHVELAPWASAFVIAPATANIMAKCAHGIADDIISTTYLCMDHVPTFFAPAMNTRMWLHPRTIENKVKLEQNAIIIPPVEKLLACGDIGVGGLADPQDIVTCVLKSITTP